MEPSARSRVAFALLAAHCACGGEVVRPAALGGTGGAGGAVASSSTGTEILPTAHVTIRAIDQLGDPVADAPALATDADGEVTAQGRTDSDGTVELDVPLEGAASLFLGPVHCDEYSCHDGVIVTLAGLEDGMSLTVPTSRPVERPTPRVGPTMDLEIVVPPLPDGAFLYRVEVPCRDGIESYYCGFGGLSFGEPIVSIPSYAGCPGAQTYDVYVILEEALFGGTIAYAAVLDQPLMPGEKVTHTVTMQEQPVVDVGWAIDAGDDEIDQAATVLLGRRKCAVSAGGWTESAGETAFHAALPPFFDEYMSWAFVDVLAKDAGRHTSWWTKPWSPALDARIPWKLGEPARLEDVVVAGTSDGRLRMTWLLADEGELGVGLSPWARYVTESSGNFLWHIFRPPTRGGSVVMPRLPPELSKYTPRQDLFVLDHGGAHDAAGVDGFADWLDGVGDDTELLSSYRSY